MALGLSLSLLLLIINNFPTNSHNFTTTFCFKRLGEIECNFFILKGLKQPCDYAEHRRFTIPAKKFVHINPFTPKSDQVQISHVASPVI